MHPVTCYMAFEDDEKSPVNQILPSTLNDHPHVLYSAQFVNDGYCYCLILFVFCSKHSYYYDHPSIINYSSKK